MVYASVGSAIASHSSARALCDHPRNLPDDLVREIARKGGIVMANSYPAFVDRKASQADAERGKEPGVGEGDAMDVSVNNEKCHRYGTCQAEAPDVFQLIEDNRLTYNRRPPEEHFAQARQAARACPMRAIEIRERVK